VSIKKIRGREVLDHAGIVQRTGVSGRTVDEWIAGSPDNGFPSRIPGTRYFPAKAVDTWWAKHQAHRRSGLTTVDRSGDPNELVIKAEVARILGYQDSRSLDNSSVLARLLERNNARDNETMSSGRTRLRWPRRVVWEVADERTGQVGRRPAATVRARVDRTGDPDELVQAPEAARVLGYADYRRLQNSAEWATLLDRVDQEEPGTGDRTARSWRRRTLWAVADQRPARPRHPAKATTPTKPPVIDRSGRPNELVGTGVAARVLGYAGVASLPQALLDQADETVELPSGRVRRRFKRRTLWKFADTAVRR